VIKNPGRTCLFAAAYDLPNEQEIMFYKLIMHTYNDDSYGHAPIAIQFRFALLTREPAIQSLCHPIRSDSVFV
jgi:hypothetical protein